jgi:hypothetical protein
MTNDAVFPQVYFQTAANAKNLYVHAGAGTAATHRGISKEIHRFTICLRDSY